MTAPTISTLPYDRRDRQPVMCYPMPWAPPQDRTAVASLMGLGVPAPGQPKAMYVHIPFCKYLCGFCPFVKYSHDEGRVEQYLADLKREMTTYARTPYLSSVEFGSLYLGGGTASILTAAQLDDLLGHARSAFRFAPDAEITLECSPITVDPAKLRAARAAGVTRVSFGVQTFDDGIGQASDVAQDGATSRQVIEWAQAAGIDSVSIDLIYNLPGQSAEQLTKDIDTALSVGVGQVTLFPLSVMPHTKLARDVESGKVDAIGDLRHELDLCTAAGDHLKQRGLTQTSVPDYSLPGVDYRHARIHFADYQDLLGLGAGAMGTVGEYTYVNVAELKRYHELVTEGVPPVNAGQKTPEHEKPRSTMAMGLRMLSVSREAFADRHDGARPEDVFGPLLASLEERGLIELTDEDIRLTDLGALFGYDVAKEFYSPEIRERGQRLAERLARKRDVVDVGLGHRSE
ncbi:coproporphyrinogen-III oxidase family protein [Streptomyces sp. 4N124]|uniref:coproporphyrinogen-III oxidase family protein n=1 Tax=Streptomyces sp. 4N124 TaxID=3457420 RepID=UPI003FD583CB